MMFDVNLSSDNSVCDAQQKVVNPRVLVGDCAASTQYDDGTRLMF
jgi:hypothetical protein